MSSELVDGCVEHGLELPDQLEIANEAIHQLAGGTFDLLLVLQKSP